MIKSMQAKGKKEAEKLANKAMEENAEAMVQDAEMESNPSSVDPVDEGADAKADAPEEASPAESEATAAAAAAIAATEAAAAAAAAAAPTFVEGPVAKIAYTADGEFTFFDSADQFASVRTGVTRLGVVCGGGEAGVAPVVELLRQIFASKGEGGRSDAHSLTPLHITCNNHRRSTCFISRIIPITSTCALTPTSVNP